MLLRAAHSTVGNETRSSCYTDLGLNPDSATGTWVTLEGLLDLSASLYSSVKGGQYLFHRVSRRLSEILREITLQIARTVCQTL